MRFKSSGVLIFNLQAKSWASTISVTEFILLGSHEGHLDEMKTT